MEEKEFRGEKSAIEELRSVREAIVRDIMKETERDMKATLREVLDKYLRQVTDMYKVEMKILKDRREREGGRY